MAFSTYASFSLDLIHRLPPLTLPTLTGLLSPHRGLLSVFMSQVCHYSLALLSLTPLSSLNLSIKVPFLVSGHTDTQTHRHAHTTFLEST